MDIFILYGQLLNSVAFKEIIKNTQSIKTFLRGDNIDQVLVPLSIDTNLSLSCL